MLSGKFTGLLNVFFLLLALTRIHSAVSGDAQKTVKLAGTLSFLQTDTSKEIPLNSEINLCDPASVSSLTVCPPNALNSLTKITVKIGNQDLKLSRTTAGDNTPCFTAGACEIFATNCAKASKLTLELGALTAAASVTYLISGRELKAVDDAFKADSATSLYIATSVGTCSPTDKITWKYVTKTQDNYVCGDTADGAVGMVASYKIDLLKTLTAEDLDQNNIGGTTVALQCSGGASSSSTLQPNTTTSTSSDAVDRLGSISVMLAAATVSTFGVMAFSG